MRLDPALRAPLLLGAFALAGALLVAGIHAYTAPRIAENERQVLLRGIHDVIPADAYDNDVLRDTVTVQDPLLGTDEPMTAYIARKQGRPAGVILPVVAPNGYSGPIRLLVGILADGRIGGVRVLAHKETPGLGDKIERSHSDWILQFTGRGLGDPPPDQWAVKRDGGAFDQFTGATISPRAVVQAVKNALLYFQANKDRLFASAAAREPQA
ncbi:MAG TPA: electron transport complex subunit RsxG [Chromatiales bacterium]|nr:electron transport complex subunit RsxG [Chromatiales bacterium]